MQNHVPSVIFKTRVRNDALGGPNPFEWKDLSSDEIFSARRIYTHLFDVSPAAL